MTTNANVQSVESWVALEANNVRKCKHHQGDDCEWCGGSGFRRKCEDVNCIEHGCNGLGKCEISRQEVVDIIKAAHPTEREGE